MTLFTKLAFLTQTFRNPSTGVFSPPTSQKFGGGSAARTGPLGKLPLHRLLSGKIEFDEAVFEEVKLGPQCEGPSFPSGVHVRNMPQFVR